MEDRRLDRLVQFDERSRNFPAVYGALEDRNFRSYTWACKTHNDQGREGACVGFAWSHELAARPKIVPTDNAYALRIYRRAQQIDPWPGEDYEGTSVLAGVKALQEISTSHGTPLITEYRWAFGIQDVLRVIGYRGPVVLGINWYNNMYTPDSNNYIHASGEIVGGHAILAKGVKIVKKNGTDPYPTPWENVDLDKSFVRLHNSWGYDYGVAGTAKLSLTDLDKLLRDQGEACIPVRRTFA